MIRLERLRVRAGDFSLAIDELSIAPGEYVMVLGPTASGKTVFLETIAGLRACRDGRVWFGDRDVTTEPPERRGAGLVYQDYALFPHLDVARNIGFGLRTRDDGSRVGELAELLGVGGLLGRYPEGLSGGERQRVALARALAIEPEVLLLDEPLSALDGPTRTELQAELKRLHRELGATVMHVTHDLDEALALGDRIAVLMEGGLRQVGGPREVTRMPADVEVARLVGLTNLFPVAAEGEGPARVRLENGWEILVDGAPAGESRGPSFAVVRADEIDLEPLGDRPVEAMRAAEATAGAAGTNVLAGTVRTVQVLSVHASIEVEIAPVGEGLPPSALKVHVLPSQADRMGIAVGAPVVLRFPGAAVHLCCGAARSTGG